VGNSIIIVTVWFNDTNGSFGIKNILKKAMKCTKIKVCFRISLSHSVIYYDNALNMGTKRKSEYHVLDIQFDMLLWNSRSSHKGKCVIISTTIFFQFNVKLCEWDTGLIRATQISSEKCDKIKLVPLSKNPLLGYARQNEYFDCCEAPPNHVS